MAGADKRTRTSTATTITVSSTAQSSWWHPSSTKTIHVGHPSGHRVVPGTTRGQLDSYHRQQRRIDSAQQFHPPTPLSHRIPSDPLVASWLRNAIRQAACDALIYAKRWRYCIAIMDDELLDWLVGTASPGNFWTPKTYMILMSSGSSQQQQRQHRVFHNEDTYHHHQNLLLSQEWEGTKTMSLIVNQNESDWGAAESVKQLRSLSSRILPRLSNSGRRATDLPVFDTIIVTSQQLQGLLNNETDRLRKQREQQLEIITHMNDDNNNSKKKEKKEKKSYKISDVPWVLPVLSSERPQQNPQLVLSLKVLQAAKQLIVVQTTS